MPPTGRSVHIGVNSPPGSRVKTPAPEAIAVNMAGWAAGQGYATTLLVGAQATVEAVRGVIHAARVATQPEDILLVTFAGHGNQLLSDSQNEGDFLDEVWMLHDGYLRDKVLYEELLALPAAARAVVVSESCYAGGMWSLLIERFKDAKVPAVRSGDYRDWFSAHPQDAEEPPPRPSLRYFLSTDESGLAFVQGDQGRFSRCLLDTLASRPSTYLELADRIRGGMSVYRPVQRPVFQQAGSCFRGARWGRPFSINPKPGAP